MSAARKTTTGTALAIVPVKKATKSEIIRQYLRDHPDAKPREVAEALRVDVGLVNSVKYTAKKKTGGAVALRGRASPDDGVMIESAIRRDGVPLVMIQTTPELHGVVFSELVARIRRHVRG